MPRKGLPQHRIQRCRWPRRRGALRLVVHDAPDASAQSASFVLREGCIAGAVDRCRAVSAEAGAASNSIRAA